MLRRDMFKVAGAGLLTPLLPKESQAEVVVPTPVIKINGRRIPVMRYEGSFLDRTELMFLHRDKRVFSHLVIAHNFKTAMNDVYEMLARGNRAIVVMDRDGYYCCCDVRPKFKDIPLHELSITKNPLWPKYRWLDYPTGPDVIVDKYGRTLHSFPSGKEIIC